MLRLIVAGLCVAVLSQASLMGVDLGSEFIKIAAVKGNSSIDIILNEQSRRKTYNFIGFRETDRFIGDDARNLAARFPANFFPMISKLAGVPFDDSRRPYFTESLHIPIDLVKNEKRGTIDVKCFKDPETQYTSDELLAMLLEFCRETTRKDSGSNPAEAVITIPHTYDMWQRNAIVQAGQMVGLRVSGLMHSTTAAALQFGIQNRGFGNETIYLAVFDMGSVAAEVGIYRIKPTPVPAKGRVKLAVSLGTIEALAIESDETLGGRMFDACIAEMLQEEFVAKGVPEVLSGKTIQQRKSVFSLMRAANKAREILSANQHTPVAIEGILPDEDYMTVITRKAFEERCDPLFKKVMALADRAMRVAGVEKKDIRNFEMMGGAGRMPRMITDMSEHLGRLIDRTLNSDESGALGAVYQAAQNSAFIRVKSFAVNDFVPEKVSFDILKADGSGYGARRVLFEKSPFGAKKSITVGRQGDFIVRFFVEVDGKEKHFSTVNVSGVKAAMATLGATEEALVVAPGNKNAFAVRLEVRLTNAGILQADEAEARFRFAVNKTKKVKVTASESLEAPTGDAATDAAAAAAAPTVVNKTVEATRRKTAPLAAATTIGYPSPMDADDVAASKAILTAIDKLERLKRATATSKNDLETYIQWVKYDGPLGQDEVKELGVITADEEEALRGTVKEAQEWLEDGEGSEQACTMERFIEKTEELKKIVTPYWDAYLEAKAAARKKEAEAEAAAAAEEAAAAAAAEPVAEEAAAAADDKKTKKGAKKTKAKAKGAKSASKKTKAKARKSKSVNEDL